MGTTEDAAGAGRRSILVVEDDPLVLSFVCRILSSCGFSVDTAANGEEGWDALQRRTYDLLVTDHEMPLLNGLDLITRLRRESLPLPVILMSGVITKGEPSRDKRNLPDVFLQKPFSIIALVTAIENLLPANRT